MNPIVAFILGLLIGWLIEWVIDWFYWRRKNEDRSVVADVSTRSRVDELELEIASYRNQLASLQTEHARLDTPIRTRAANRPVVTSQTPAAQVQKRDSLVEIKGVSPAMAERLNESSVYTFTDLGALHPQKLKEIVGEQLAQPGSEVEIIKQARLTAGMIKKVDDLEVIGGIDPVIARMLNAAGIFTFAELSDLTVRDLREIVGERIQRIADEQQILSQARQLAEKQNRGG